MVLLTMTPAIVAAIRKCEAISSAAFEKLQLPGEPTLGEPSAGNPISHGQLVELSKTLKEHFLNDAAGDEEPVAYRLNDLVRGCKVYVPPPKPKPEPTPEFKSLMERLRREEEARAYERMLNPQFQPETFAQRFRGTPHAHLFPSEQDIAKQEEDEMTYADVNRQLTLILNVLISIICCSIVIWLVARHWNTPARLALSMTGSLVVAIAEVTIYAGYIRRIKEAKQKEKKTQEHKEVLETWVIEPSKSGAKKNNNTITSSTNHGSVRFRKSKHG